MRKLWILLSLTICVTLGLKLSFATQTNLESYISSSSYYANGDTISADSTHTDTVRALRVETLLAEVFIDSLSDSLHIALLGSRDNVHFVNLSETGYTTITATGNYAFLFNDAEAYQYYTVDFLTHYGTGTLQATVHFYAAKKF